MYNSYILGIKEKSLLQLANAMKNRPNALIIDAFYTRYSDKEFQEFLNCVVKQNPEMIVVVVSAKESHLINYSRVLKISDLQE